MGVRLESEAESGEVLVSENTKILLEDFFEFSSKRVIRPKGVPHPLNCYSVALEKSLSQESILGECFKLVINDANLTENDLNRLRTFIAKYPEQSEGKNQASAATARLSDASDQPWSQRRILIRPRQSLREKEGLACIRPLCPARPAMRVGGQTSLT